MDGLFGELQIHPWSQIAGEALLEKIVDMFEALHIFSFHVHCPQLSQLRNAKQNCAPPGRLMSSLCWTAKGCMQVYAKCERLKGDMR